MPFRELELNLKEKNNAGVGVDVTQKCQAQCPTCFYEEIPEEINEISFDLFKKIVDEATDNNFKELYLLGGEPALHREIFDFIDYAVAKDKFDPLILVTNGLKLEDETFCQEVAKRGVTVAVQRHVIGDGRLETEIQDQLMGIKGTLPKINRAFENIEKYFEPDKVAVQCCITRPVVDSEQIFKVFEYAREHGFEQVIECTKAGENFPRGNPLDVTPQELLTVYRKLQEIDKAKYPHLAAKILTPQAYGKVCHMPETGIHVLINGDVVPCVGQQYVLGNIMKGDKLSEILESDKRKFFQSPEDRIEGHCSECDYMPDCTGGCRGDAYYLTDCFNASAVQCPQLYEKAKKGPLEINDIIPKDCSGCEMENDDGCGITVVGGGKDKGRFNRDRTLMGKTRRYFGRELFADYSSISSRFVHEPKNIDKIKK